MEALILGGKIITWPLFVVIALIVVIPVMFFAPHWLEDDYCPKSW